MGIRRMFSAQRHGNKSSSIDRPVDKNLRKVIQPLKFFQKERTVMLFAEASIYDLHVSISHVKSFKVHRKTIKLN